jgi:chitosanase
MVSLSLLHSTVCGLTAVLTASLVSDVRADASDIPLDSVGGGLTKNDMDTIMSMVSIPENANTEWWTNYNYCEDIQDGRGFTVSLVGFSSGTGDLLEVVRDVKSMSPNHPLTQFIPALEAAKGSATHKGLASLCSAIKANGDVVWKKAVWLGIQRDSLGPALDWAAKKNLTSVFSKGFFYDVVRHHGVASMDKFAAYVKPGVQPPSNGGDEVAYMQAYIQARIEVERKDLDPSANQDLIGRTLMWKSVLDKNNLGLQRPMTLTCYGETFTISDSPHTTTL